MGDSGHSHAHGRAAGRRGARGVRPLAPHSGACRGSNESAWPCHSWVSFWTGALRWRLLDGTWCSWRQAAWWNCICARPGGAVSRNTIFCKMQDAKCRGHGVSTSEARARSGSSLVRQVPNGFHLACGDVVKIRLLIGPYHRHLDLFCSHSSPFVEASPKACVMPPWIVRTNDDESSRVAAAKLLGPSQSQVACTGWHHLQRINGGQYFVSFLCQRADRGLIVEYRAGHARGSEPGIPEGRDLPKSSTEGIGSPPAPFLEGWTVEGVGGETARYCSASTPAASTRPVLRCF